MNASPEKIRAAYDAAMNRIKTVNIHRFPDYPDPVILISNVYPGVWLEHIYDGVRWAQLEPDMADVARAQVKLFLDQQKEDGQLPCYVLDRSNPGIKAYGALVGYRQIQECVSFGRLCLEAAQLNNDPALLEEAYEKCAKWDGWLVKNRMTMNTGLIELFCLFDTGHDNSARLDGIPGSCPGSAANCSDVPFLPLLAPDMNAVFYGDRMALADMAALLGRPDEAEMWREKAESVRKALKEHCWCEEDEFYYDADCRGQLRKFRSIHISNLFQEHVLSQDEADRIYERHMKNPAEFWTPFPFPGMAANDEGFKPLTERNCWGYFSQANTALRTLRWMDYYGKGDDLEELMRRWVDALVCADEVCFGQELHPMTGVPTGCSPWYSTCMLFFISACRRLGYVKD